MPELPRISGRDAIKVFERLGFQIVRQKDSHVVLRKGSHGCVVSSHAQLAIGTLRGVICQAGITVDTFLQAISRNVPSAHAEVKISAAKDALAPGCFASLATCNDLTALKALYPQYCFCDGKTPHAWGLKQVGTLFCIHKFQEFRPMRILEVGAGCQCFFDLHFGHDHEYWMADDAGFYDERSFSDAMAKRQKTKFIQTMLGSFCPQLPDEYFDLVFSVSVLEHVPREKLTEAYRDIFRIVRPGGYMVHSIDGHPNGDIEAIQRVGFVLDATPDLSIRTRSTDGPATLFEPLEIVFSYYGRNSQKEKLGKNRFLVSQHYPTLLVCARKP